MHSHVSVTVNICSVDKHLVDGLALSKSSTFGMALMPNIARKLMPPSTKGLGGTVGNDGNGTSNVLDRAEANLSSATLELLEDAFEEHVVVFSRHGLHC